MSVFIVDIFFFQNFQHPTFPVDCLWVDSPLPFNYFVKGAYDPSLYQASSQQPLAHLRTNRLPILLPTTQTQSYQLIFESTP